MQAHPIELNFDHRYDFAGLVEFCLDRRLPQWVHPDFDMPILDLGPGNKTINGPTVVRLDWPEWDAEDVDCLGHYEDETIGGIFAINLLEHLNDPRPLIREMGRVLRPGCPATIWVPHARSGMYLQDLDHKTPFILDTWKNFLEPHPYYAKDHEPVPLLVGFNCLFGIKEENVGILTQLIKKTLSEDLWNDQ